MAETEQQEATELAGQARPGSQTIRLRGEPIFTMSRGIIAFLRGLGAVLTAMWAWTFYGIWADVRIAKTALSGWEDQHGKFDSLDWRKTTGDAKYLELSSLMHEGPIPDLYLTSVMTLPLAALAVVSFFLLLAGWRSRRRVYVSLFLGATQIALYFAYHNVFVAIDDVTT